VIHKKGWKIIMAKEPFTAKLTSVWIGGLFYWALKGFSGKFTNQLTGHNPLVQAMGF
jgi:hypothetical protein